jgi:hypothetical protein
MRRYWNVDDHNGHVRWKRCRGGVARLGRAGQQTPVVTIEPVILGCGRRLVDHARDQGRIDDVASVAAGHLANLLIGRGDLTAALAVATDKAELTRAAELGPWTQAADEARRLRILAAMGHHREVLDQATALLAHLDILPTDPDPDPIERIDP